MTLEAIYARIPAMECKRLCHTACVEPRLAPAEIRNVEKAMLRPVRAARTEDGVVLMGEKCPLLSGVDCTVYARRPAICRLYGTHWTLRCPHGCIPDRWLTDEEFISIMADVRKVA